MTRAERLHHLARRRPGPLGAALLPLTWVLLGLGLLVYVVGVMLLGVAAVLVATLRLVLTPPLSLLGRATAGAGPRDWPRD